MVFNLAKSSKYIKQIKYLMRNDFYKILLEVQKIEEILEDGSWLQPDIKSQYKIERLYDQQGNLWKCKYIYDWRVVFRVAGETIRLIDLDKRDTIYSNLN